MARGSCVLNFSRLSSIFIILAPPTYHPYNKNIYYMVHSLKKFILKENFFYSF